MDPLSIKWHQTENRNESGSVGLDDVSLLSLNKKRERETGKF